MEQPDSPEAVPQSPIQTPPVPQDEDEREPMFLQPHDPDYVSEPMYPEYIPLEDEHVFPAEEQPLPPIVSPTTESPGYVAESDPEEYKDDDYHLLFHLLLKMMLMAYSLVDDADDEDEDEEDEEEEEEHLAPADSAVVVPTVELVSLPKGTEPVTPPPSTDITTTGGERLARIASTQALIDAVTVALPSPPLPPQPPSLYIPPPVDCRDDIPESELPPRKRLCFSTLGSKYEGIREVGYGIRDTWVDPAKAVPEIAPMTLGEVNTRVIELAELHEHDTQDLYALQEDA
ncbi:hypothetical protein Tco_1068970 [Tanacetum coccineum]|uniref:Uncharacterized protein n=1 Tax=Tanacetum coccineum TaxID=301880 RepID=A0ABQ5HH49_9ASTR